MRSSDTERKAGPVLLPLVLLFVLLLAGVALSGCQHRIEPPASVSDPVNVFVIDYGRHASLALPADEDGLVEWSWGDWDWFALERTGIQDGLRALFASRRSTLSRRALAAAESADDVSARLGAENVLSMEVERVRAAALQRELEARWRQGRDEAVAHPGGRVFVPEDRRYSLFNSSVHEVARWLEALGAKVTGMSLTANFTLREP
jgi:hypothetical protein